MRYIRFCPPGGQPCYGRVEGSRVRELAGDLFGEHRDSPRSYNLADLNLLPPCLPSKIVALGTNFTDHAAEMNKPRPAEPKIFLKAPSALIGHGAAIRLPEVPGSVEHEAEAAVIIGRKACDVPETQALDHIFGFTCLNDVTARELQRRDGVFARAKGFDTFSPCGPWIETGLDWETLEVEGLVNGQRRQHGSLSTLIFGVPMVLSFISSIMTLLPGDIISLGTPSGVGPLLPGDKVEVRVSGIGSLVNPVEKRVRA